MIFGSKPEAPAEAAHAPEGEAHAAATPADAHAAPVGPEAAPNKPGKTAAAQGKTAAAQGHGDQKQAAATEVASAEPKKEEGGFLSSIMGMFSGSSEEKPAATPAKPAATQAKAAAQEPAPEPRTSAEGGKRWSKSTGADAKRSEEVVIEAAPPRTDGSTDADAAGAAWLAKMRGQPASAPAPAKPAQAASASDAKSPAAKAVH